MASGARPTFPVEIIRQIVSIAIAHYIDDLVVGPLYLWPGQDASNSEEVSGNVEQPYSSQLIAMSGRTSG